MSRIPVSANAEPSASQYLVKVVYLIPTNRTQQTNAVEKLRNYIKICQQLYAKDMARNGFYKPGTTEGQTFEYEADASGEPIIHVLNGSHDDAYYRGDVWGRVLNDVLPYYPVNKSVILIMPEIHKMNADATVSGGVALGAQWGSTGAWGGVGMIGSNCLWFLDSAKFPDTTPYDGLVLPEFDNIPMKQDVTFAWFEGTTIGQIAGCYHGAAAHELGHAFGMPHCFVNDNNFAGDLMGNGLRGFRGEFGDYPGEWCRMLKAECDLIAKSRYFNPGSTLTESTAPTRSWTVTIEDPISSSRSIHVKGAAADASGVYASVAYMTPPDSTIESGIYDASGSVDYHILAAKVPGGLPARSYNIDLHAIDNQGNRQWDSKWVQVPASMSTQYYTGSSWSNLPANGWTYATDIKFNMSMTARATNVTLYPEAEIRPVGTPFTNVPNYISSTGFAYAGDANDPGNGSTAIMGNLQVSLPAGTYHWQYRLRTSTGSYSSWVTMGTNDPNVKDFGIDTTAPAVPIVNDSGQYTSSLTQLTGSWRSTDGESSVLSYSVAVGTSPTDPGSGYVKNWTIFTSTSGTLTGMTLTNGQRYYIYVKALNGAGTYSPVGVSDGITVKTGSPKLVKIKDAKSELDGSYVKVESVLASTVMTDFGDCFYVEQPDRSCGIMVDCIDAGAIQSFNPGQAMTITGLMGVVGSERAIRYPSIQFTSGSKPVYPLVINGRMLGGEAQGLQSGIELGKGLNNIGLLVTVVGKVTGTGVGEFTIDAGAGPVKVKAYNANDSLTGCVIVTGIASCYADGEGKVRRMIRALSVTPP